MPQQTVLESCHELWGRRLQFKHAAFERVGKYRHTTAACGCLNITALEEVREGSKTFMIPSGCGRTILCPAHELHDPWDDAEENEVIT